MKKMQIMILTVVIANLCSISSAKENLVAIRKMSESLYVPAKIEAKSLKAALMQLEDAVNQVVPPQDKLKFICKSDVEKNILIKFEANFSLNLMFELLSQITNVDYELTKNGVVFEKRPWAKFEKPKE